MPTTRFQLKDGQREAPATSAATAPATAVKRVHEDPRVQATLEIMSQNYKLTVPAAMKEAKFSEAESNTKKLQMRIHRRLPASRKVLKAMGASIDKNDDDAPKLPIRKKPRPPKPKKIRKKHPKGAVAKAPLTHANTDIYSLGGKIARTVPRKSKASPELIAARTEYRHADTERTEASSALAAAQKAFDEAQRNLEAAKTKSQMAEERYLKARSAVEEVDLQSLSPRDKKWTEMYEQLKAYHALHGHVRIPTKCPPELQALSRFCSQSRQRYSRYVLGETTTYKPHQLVLLEKLGVFVYQWQDKFNQLVEYKSLHGHCNVPTRSTNADERLKKLGHWVGYQRSEYRKHQNGQKNQLSDERIKMLEDVGFVFNVFAEKGIVRKRKYGKKEEEEEEELLEDALDQGEGEDDGAEEEPQNDRQHLGGEEQTGGEAIGVEEQQNGQDAVNGVEEQQDEQNVENDCYQDQEEQEESTNPHQYWQDTYY